jgi:hypothetical protein
MPRYTLNVERMRINKKAESEKREHFSQIKASEYMGDGGETFQITGLGYGRPEIMESYKVNYSPRMQRRYGTVEYISFTEKKGAFKRMVVDICQVGTIDLLVKGKEIEDGPNWATMQKEIALVSLSMSRGINQIAKKLPNRVSNLLKYLLENSN